MRLFGLDIFSEVEKKKTDLLFMFLKEKTRIVVFRSINIQSEFMLFLFPRINIKCRVILIPSSHFIFDTRSNMNTMISCHDLYPEKFNVLIQGQIWSPSSSNIINPCPRNASNKARVKARCLYFLGIILGTLTEETMLGEKDIIFNFFERLIKRNHFNK